MNIRATKSATNELSARIGVATVAAILTKMEAVNHNSDYNRKWLWSVPASIALAPSRSIAFPVKKTVSNEP